MKVSELITELLKLDQDKEIKGIEDTGHYEYVPETTKDIYITEYKNTIDDRYQRSFVGDCGEDKDFYIISGEDYDITKRD